MFILKQLTALTKYLPEKNGLERGRACVSDVLLQLVSITVQNSTIMVYRKWGINKVFFSFSCFFFSLNLRPGT